MTYQYIDLDCLNAIADGDRDFKIEIINKYLEKTPVYLAQIQSSMDRQAYDDIFLDVHRLKGSIMFVGRDTLVNAAKEMELASKAGCEMATLHTMFQHIKEISLLADTELKQVLALLEQEQEREQAEEPE